VAAMLFSSLRTGMMTLIRIAPPSLPTKLRLRFRLCGVESPIVVIFHAAAIVFQSVGQYVVCIFRPMLHQPFSAAAKILLKPNVDAGDMELAIVNDYAPRMVDVFTGTLLQQHFGILTRIRSGL